MHKRALFRKKDLGEKMNKKASIPILALVVMTAILVTSALMAFYFSSSSSSSVLGDFSAMDEIGLKKEQIDFYVNEVIEKSLLRVDRTGDIKMQFVNSFNEELGKYKKNGNYILGELSQVEGNVNPQSVELRDGKLYLNLNFRLESDKDKMKVSCLYNRRFTRII